MATVKLFSAFSFLQAQDWDFNVTTHTANSLALTSLDGVYQQRFTGSFAYDAFGNVSGTVTSTTFLKNGATVYTATGMNHSAAQLQAYAEATGDTQAMYAYVLSGNDGFTGSGGGDTILGYGGNDTISGAGGNDVIDGGLGADLMLGGAGNDTYTVNSTSDRVLETTTASSGVDAGGVDLVKSSVAHTLAAFVENLTLTGTSAIAGTGNGMANTMVGNGAANTLSGRSGNDVLRGGGGNDVIAGGTGKDTMTGNSGNDRFDFNSTTESGLTTSTRDVIVDFTRGQDKIDLSTIDAKPATSGTNDAFSYIGTQAFTAAGQVRIIPDMINSTITVQVNTDADASAEMTIRLNGLSTLAASDFIL